VPRSRPCHDEEPSDHGAEHDHRDRRADGTYPAARCSWSGPGLWSALSKDGPQLADNAAVAVPPEVKVSITARTLPLLPVNVNRQYKSRGLAIPTTQRALGARPVHAIGSKTGPGVTPTGSRVTLMGVWPRFTSSHSALPSVPMLSGRYSASSPRRPRYRSGRGRQRPNPRTIVASSRALLLRNGGSGPASDAAPRSRAERSPGRSGGWNRSASPTHPLPRSAVCAPSLAATETPSARSARTRPPV